MEMWLGNVGHRVYDGRSHTEVCGEGAPAVRPDDAEGLAEAMDRLMTSDAERRRWAEAGRVQAARFTWARCAEDTLTAYEQALRRS